MKVEKSVKMTVEEAHELLGETRDIDVIRFPKLFELLDRLKKALEQS